MNCELTVVTLCTNDCHCVSGERTRKLLIRDLNNILNNVNLFFALKVYRNGCEIYDVKLENAEVDQV